MAVRKAGLGKGLDSLIPEHSVRRKAEKTEQKPEKNELLLKITDIEPNREQPRKHFDEDALLELSDSIKQFGIIQPLIVQKKEDHYEIIAGERRWRAAKMAVVGVLDLTARQQAGTGHSHSGHGRILQKITPGKSVRHDTFLRLGWAQDIRL